MNYCMLLETHLETTSRMLPKALYKLLTPNPLRRINRSKERSNRVAAKTASSLSIALALLPLALPLSAAVQEAFEEAQEPIKIQYGFVAQHYATSWSAPSLPASVVRGTPPPLHVAPIDDNIRNNGAVAANPAPVPDDNSHPNGPAVLYAVDLGHDGMVMILSAKTSLRPGTCIAVERSRTYTNLRSVNVGYCDAMNRETVASLASVNEAAARRCMIARQAERTESTDASPPLQPAEIAILCDGG